MQLFPTHACREHTYIMPLLIQNCGYSRERIPQLEDVSRFLHGASAGARGQEAVYAGRRR